MDSLFTRTITLVLIAFTLLLLMVIAAGGEGWSPSQAQGGPENPADDYDPSLSAVVVGDFVLCGDSGNDTYTTISSTPVVLRQCTLTVPMNGVFFISADATADYLNGDYEA